MELLDFDAATFLREHWQRQPLLLKNPWREWLNPLAPDELAGLACEDEVESRLVLHARNAWKLERGPFPESRFGKLPKGHWTLLVQAVDQWVPEVAELLEPFRFLPDWRIDDVMVSYAADQGSVGPHFDQYDVFLIQGLGRRRWQVGDLCDAHTPLLPHPDLRLLAAFEPRQEWVLEPGDILYLPPGFAHWGVAEGDDCMTYSVGFRAPSRAELISHFCDHLLADLDDDDRYRDGALVPAANPGEIDAQALARLRELALARLDDPTAFADWFGGYATARKYPEQQQPPARAISAAQLARKLDQGKQLVAAPGARLAFRRDGDTVILFADGAALPCADTDAELATALCAGRVVPAPVPASAFEWLCGLYNQGSLVWA